MKEKKGLDLRRVVLLGRTYEEYARFFALGAADLVGKTILDVAGGVSSFAAEAAARGLDVRAFDRIYEWPAAEIARRCEADLAEVAGNIGGREVYRWDFYKSADGMRIFRERAYQTFLRDLEARPEIYVAGDLPRLPFKDGEFDLTLGSYLLFVYEEQLSYEFHLACVRELMRVTRGEIRIYPTVTFEAERSEYLDRLRGEPEFGDWTFTEIRTDFEFLRGSNCFVRIARRGRNEARSHVWGHRLDG